jgi:uncharacterized protein (DUF488 family)
MGEQPAFEPTRPVIYTIGHSNLELDRFIGALRAYDISTVVDVRSMPYSRYAPWFNRDNLKVELETAGIDYRFAGDFLGGRPTDPTCYFRGVVPPSDANFLREVDYPEVAKRPWFRRGIARVLSLAQEGAVAIMCSEEDPNVCHRYHLISQALLAETDVLDIRTEGGEIRTTKATQKMTQTSLL